MSLLPIGTRLLNQSADTYEVFNRADPQGPRPADFLKFIDNQVGVPLGVAAVNTAQAHAVYVANTPFLGIQAISLANFVQSLFLPQVDGRLAGTYRAVTIVRNRVLAAGQDQTGGKLVLLSPELAPISNGAQEYPLGPVNPLEVTGLEDWPVRVEVEGGTTTTARDLAVAACGTGQLCVVPVDAAAGMFVSTEAARVRTPGGMPRGSVGVPSDQLLYVADGTAGLTIIDLADLSRAAQDADGDGRSDGVLATVALEGAQAVRVGHYRDASGRPIAAVAAGDAGVCLVQVGEACGNGCRTCQRCDVSVGVCVDDTALDPQCCQRASTYERYRDTVPLSDPRKLFAQALHCVGNGICRSLGPGGSQFDSPESL